MDREKDPGQLKVVDLDRGLFHIQYQSADDEALPPKVVISPAPDHERKVELAAPSRRRPGHALAAWIKPGGSDQLAGQASCPGVAATSERIEGRIGQIRAPDPGQRPARKSGRDLGFRNGTSQFVRSARARPCRGHRRRRGRAQ